MKSTSCANCESVFHPYSFCFFSSFGGLFFQRMGQKGITTWGRCKWKCFHWLNIDLAFSFPHKHNFTMSVLMQPDVFYSKCRSSSQAMAGDEKRFVRLSKTYKVKGYQTNGLKQIQSWHGDSAALVPRTRPPAEHFNNAVSEEHCQILVFPNTWPQLQQPPLPPALIGIFLSLQLRDWWFVSWASRLRPDGWRVNKTWGTLVFTSYFPLQQVQCGIFPLLPSLRCSSAKCFSGGLGMGGNRNKICFHTRPLLLINI